MNRALIGAIVLTVGVATAVVAQTELRRSVIAAGGGTASGASHVADGTVGEAVVGLAAGSTTSAGAGFWSDGFAAIVSTSPVLTPVSFQLWQNSPNPFNPVTSIRFDLAATVDARLVVYGVDGRVVKTLVAGTLPAGRHSVRWDGRDGIGAKVASGIYFYQLETTEFVSRRKLVLLK